MTIEDPIVLLVDDSVEDGILMRSAFGRAGFAEPLRTVQDGDEAIAYLRGDGAFSDRQQFPMPTVVLLDLNMPRKGGFEVLAWVRQQPALKRMRVYVLSTSSRTADIDRAYDLGANSYLVKPGTLDGLMHMSRCLVAWLKLSHFAPIVEGGDTVSRFPTDTAYAIAS
jgi:CheY-like chemotaxis protein